MTVTPLAWQDRPSLIESILPAQKISAEAQKERKAGAGQTLTALGSYWKGRNRLILNKACILGALLPTTDDSEADLANFEMLMAIDDEAFLRRGMRPSCLSLFKHLYSIAGMREDEVKRLFVIRRRKEQAGKPVWEYERSSVAAIDALEGSRDAYLDWAEDISEEEKHAWELRWVQSFDYLKRVGMAKRPEEIEADELFGPVWNKVNCHLGTNARSIHELVEQMGILRFGHRPKVADTFSGSGQIPFEAARLGCDVYASDLNPVACMLTWAAMNIVGADGEVRKMQSQAHKQVMLALDQEIRELQIEHDNAGNRAKAYLYCLETICPQTGWSVPLLGTRLISLKYRTVVKLLPDHGKKRFDIQVSVGASDEDLEAAKTGTVIDGDLTYLLNGEEFRTSIKTIRKDYRLEDGSIANRLRKWEQADFSSRPDDIFQERLYAIQWVKKGKPVKECQRNLLCGCN